MSGSFDERKADPSQYRIIVEQIGRISWKARAEGPGPLTFQAFYAWREARAMRKAQRWVNREVSAARRRLDTRRVVEVVRR